VRVGLIRAVVAMTVAVAAAVAVASPAAAAARTREEGIAKRLSSNKTVDTSPKRRKGRQTGLIG
jgi:hypothetical protein